MPRFARGNFTPPPKGMRTVEWTKDLAILWGGYHKVVLPIQNVNRPARRAMREWCEMIGGKFWHSRSGLCWYFQDQDTALMFKIAFGGGKDLFDFGKY